MKIRGREAERILADPASLRGVLLFGPEAGLVQARSRQILKNLLGDKPDVFALREIETARLKAAPSLLAQEAASPPLTGGRVALRLRGGAGAEAARALAIFLETKSAGGFLLIEAGALPPSSALRRRAEEAKNFAAIGCYAESAAETASYLKNLCEKESLTIDPGALALFAQRLSGDRGMAERESEKLILYAMSDPSAPISAEDVLAATGENLQAGLEDPARAAASGDREMSLYRLTELQSAGQSAAAILAVTQFYFQRLHLVVSLRERGTPIAQALSLLRPPLHFSRREAFLKQCRLWRAADLSEISRRIWEALAASREKGAPQEALCAQILLSAAARASRARLSPERRLSS